MNKTAIKNFATWARNKLIADITYKAGLLGITENEICEPLPQSTPDMQFFDIGTATPYAITGKEINQRRQLVNTIQKSENKHADYVTAFNAVVEEVAYTWFNRLIAIRFMEVNDYLPSRIRVLSSEKENKTEPDLVTNPFEANLPFTDAERTRIVQLKQENQLDELFQMLVLKQCNELNKILPELFDIENDQTILLNITFANKDSVVWHLVHDIDERDFKIRTDADDVAIARGELSEEDAPAGQVEIIGWLYQYYNTEPKQEVFDLLKKNVKVTKERVPAATQLFTPDWIVRYMVENSLGRLWLERHPNETLKAQWKYYVEEAEQEPAVAEQLRKMRSETPINSPEDITFIDPCMGSGHILVYAFDVLMQIYISQGYSQRDAAELIVTKNLFGLDIDKRAYQLAHFAVMMKARQYNRRVLVEGSRKTQIMCFQDAVEINPQHAAQWGNKEFDALLAEFKDVDTYGSLLKIKGNYNYDELITAIETTQVNAQTSLEEIPYAQMLGVVKLAKVLTQKYDVVCTNPPYMGGGNMNGKMAEFVKKNYPDSKSDLFAVFIERCKEMVKVKSYFAMITQHAWMFLSSYEKLRAKLAQIGTVNMAHLGARAFAEIGGEVVQTTTFVMRNTYMEGYKGVYVRLIDSSTAEQKEIDFLSGNGRYIASTDNFAKIPGMPIAYWVSEKMLNSFVAGTSVSDFAVARNGMKTGDNNKFIRLWWEVNETNTCFNAKTAEEAIKSKLKWFPYNKGGEFRKWYGNNDYIVNWKDGGREVFGNAKIDGRNVQDYPDEMKFEKSATWSLVTSGQPAFRFKENNLSDIAGMSLYLGGSKLLLLLGFCNTKIAEGILQVLAPTINFQAGDIARLPIILSESSFTIDGIVTKNIMLSHFDWDSFEISWDFKRDPLIKGVFKRSVENDLSEKYMEASYMEWKQFTESQFLQLKVNEEELNRIFIDIYGLQEELTPDVADKDVTVARIYDRKEDIPESMKGNNYVLTKTDVVKSFISYAVGCMFGRYSLDVEGLAYAGGEWDDSKYSTFLPDKDNILPITDEEYYEDDIVGLFVAFVKKVYGNETLEENLDFIAEALGNKGNSSREVIRNYFLNDFFKDHCKTYQKRPIYWLFDSGKANGFKALVYMHRYDENTIGNLRIDYLHRIQQVYNNELDRMQETIDNSTNGREVTAAEKRKEKLTKQLKEARDYDTKIGHLVNMRTTIDLDDGVKVNYEKVQTDTEGNKITVLAKIG